ncbi:MAG TPA: hypothetical protein VKG92_02780 [Flavobacteriales bacterium]|nr:hypothetical protein [Flavobacteriales bacterium]
MVVLGLQMWCSLTLHAADLPSVDEISLRSAEPEDLGKGPSLEPEHGLAAWYGVSILACYWTYVPAWPEVQDGGDAHSLLPVTGRQPSAP